MIIHSRWENYARTVLLLKHTPLPFLLSESSEVKLDFKLSISSDKFEEATLFLEDLLLPLPRPRLASGSAEARPPRRTSPKITSWSVRMLRLGQWLQHWKEKVRAFCLNRKEEGCEFSLLTLDLYPEAAAVAAERADRSQFSQSGYLGKKTDSCGDFNERWLRRSRLSHRMDGRPNSVNDSTVEACTRQILSQFCSLKIHRIFFSALHNIRGSADFEAPMFGQVAW